MVHFATTGQAPSASALAQQLGRSTAEVEAALERLEALHALALAPASKTIWMEISFFLSINEISICPGGIADTCTGVTAWSQTPRHLRGASVPGALHSK